MHSTILAIKEGVKNNSYTSSVKFGMVTQWPTGDTNGWMLTGYNLEDLIDVDGGFLDHWRVRLVDDCWTVNELIDDKDGDDVCTVVNDWREGGSDDVDDNYG